ncbi:MAG: type IV toxin-antitoxin system AbiEi family antitoxin [Candidatus Accumulibacter sp.]|uniref:type IV toxin-antitoxin system AbiEi family antitoxin n=1 Tax=Accumulibacter sp. TaxID=2053492 RepID=UPI0025CE7BD1|nr:type IV toxin-antitoxin system AbiEi family antitoxin [Accumulibacter sp.]MCM8598913.1 type IV toxin-antitoxin system AbiEi family antitoxin [Accumulibacter sp.]MCM8610674.1 type IV toxin-antitoxin system AbiEi family antitoxin [Accumulibacter sp.]
MDKDVDLRDLLTAALKRLEAYGLTARIERREVQLPRTRADALVRIGYGDREATYAVEMKRGLRPNGLGAVLHQLERLGEQGLLVADHVTPPMAEELRARKIPFVDAAGNAFLDQPPLFVWVKGEKTRAVARGNQLIGRAFQASGLQVLFALICHPEWVELPYREIAQRAAVAHGTVGWVMAELPKLGFLAELRGKRRLMQRERLLQQWAEFYPRALRPRLLLGRYRAENLAWWDTIEPTKYGAVLGGEPAGGRLTHYLRPGAATFYTQRIDPRLLVDLRLRQDDSGNVEIYRRFWTFNGDEVSLAPTPLVYADLMATGDGRCIETARMIYDQHLFRTDA